MSNTDGKKSGGILKWLLLGCLGLIVLGAVIVAAGGFFVAKKVKEVADNPMRLVETIIELNPELEVLDNDEGSKKITVRNKKSGETQTFDWTDVKEGRIRFEGSEEGSFEIDAQGEDGAVVTSRSAQGEVSRTTFGVTTDAPDFFPVYPRTTESHAGFRTKNDKELAGMFTFKTGDNMKDVLAFYSRELESKGFKVEQQTFEGFGQEGANLTAKKAADGITLNLLLGKDGNTTGVTVTYSAESS